MFVLCLFAVFATDFGIAGDYLLLFFICDGLKIMSALVVRQFTLLFKVSVLLYYFIDGNFCHQCPFTVLQYDLLSFLVFILI